ncbi:hypothetical protein GCM10009798_44140 [Nocardioides panacihumi]|uniref:Uncharacterized protein n=1 Tax=Nocardioides panacihumi TaxID=400774 RepID=A0ABN2S052_9ACTN
MDDSERLRELHDTYVWEVNAAVGEGRLDLVWQLADEFLDEVLELLTSDEEMTCGRADCLVCNRPRPPEAAPRPRRWTWRGRRQR